jgi:hypothetical protein
LVSVQAKAVGATSIEQSGRALFVLLVSAKALWIHQRWDVELVLVVLLFVALAGGGRWNLRELVYCCTCTCECTQ